MRSTLRGCNKAWLTHPSQNHYGNASNVFLTIFPQVLGRLGPELWEVYCPAADHGTVVLSNCSGSIPGNIGERIWWNKVSSGGSHQFDESWNSPRLHARIMPDGTSGHSMPTAFHSNLSAANTNCIKIKVCKHRHSTRHGKSVLKNRVYS